MNNQSARRCAKSWNTNDRSGPGPETLRLVWDQRTLEVRCVVLYGLRSAPRAGTTLRVRETEISLFRAGLPVKRLVVRRTLDPQGTRIDLDPVVVDEATHAWLVANPGAEVEIDLPSTTLRLPDGRSVSFPVEAFARYCLMNGVDELGYLLKQADAISAYERRAG